jgi:hypothetical protein
MAELLAHAPLTQVPILFETEEDEESNDQHQEQVGSQRVEFLDPSGDETLFAMPSTPKRRKTMSASPATAPPVRNGRNKQVVRKRTTVPAAHRREPSPDPEELFV